MLVHCCQHGVTEHSAQHARTVSSSLLAWSRSNTTDVVTKSWQNAKAEIFRVPPAWCLTEMTH